MINKVPIILTFLLLVGCSSNQYSMYSKVKEAEVMERAAVEKAKYDALKTIAGTGDTTATVAAIISMQMQKSNAGNISMSAPVSNSDRALQWAQIITPALIPALSNAYSVNQQSEVSKANIKYGTQATIATNKAFVDMAGQIQAPTFNYDSTHSPTVVEQPDPTIVTQPEPTVITQPDPIFVDPVIVEPQEPTIVDPVIVNQSAGEI